MCNVHLQPQFPFEYHSVLCAHSVPPGQRRLRRTDARVARNLLRRKLLRCAIEASSRNPTPEYMPHTRARNRLVTPSLAWTPEMGKKPRVGGPWLVTAQFSGKRS